MTIAASNLRSSPATYHKPNYNPLAGLVQQDRSWHSEQSNYNIRRWATIEYPYKFLLKLWMITRKHMELRWHPLWSCSLGHLLIFILFFFHRTVSHPDNDSQTLEQVVCESWSHRWGPKLGQSSSEGFQWNSLLKISPREWPTKSPELSAKSCGMAGYIW